MGSSILVLIAGADKVIAVSEKEKGLITQDTGRSHGLFVWGHVHDTYTPLTSFSERKDILFVGGFLNSPSPNEDAIVHFVKSIFPRVRQALPGVRLIVVGADPPQAVAGLASPAVVITGYVEDLQAYYESCRLFVAPMRYGAGINYKLTEAMSGGLPAVVSELAASSLNLRDGVEALICKDDQEFAEKTIELYRAGKLWLKVQEGARKYVDDHYHPNRMRKALVQLLESPRTDAGHTGGTPAPSGRAAARTLSALRVRKPWYRLPARVWYYYREGGPRVVLSKAGVYLRARLLGR